MVHIDPAHEFQPRAENGAWKCIQAQIQTVAPECYPSDDTIVRVYLEGKLQP